MTFSTLIGVQVATGPLKGPAPPGEWRSQPWFTVRQLWEPAAGGSSANDRWQQWPIEAERGLAGRRAVLGAADTSGGVESALLHTLPGLREKARGGAGPAVGCGGPGSPSASPRLAHTSGLLWGKGPRCCPQGTCDKSLTLMEGNESKTLLLGRGSITRPVNSRGASTRSNWRCTLGQEGRSRPTCSWPSNNRTVLRGRQNNKSQQRHNSAASHKIQGQRRHCISDGEWITRAMYCSRTQSH